MLPTPSPGLSPFLTDAEPIELPVAHGEGKFVVGSGRSYSSHLETSRGSSCLRYSDVGRASLTTSLPRQPQRINQRSVAGLCDPSGQIFGLMPHPERFTSTSIHHPRNGPAAASRSTTLVTVFRIFRNAVLGTLGQLTGRKTQP